MPSPLLKKTTWLGIDPGANGGLAAISLTPDGRIDVESAIGMPETEEEIWDWFARYALLNTFDVQAVIERVSGWVGGKAEYAAMGAPGSAMFNFGVSYGGLRMALVGNGIPFKAPVPRTWQKAMEVIPRDRKGGETQHQFKRRLKDMAHLLFPSGLS